MPDNTVDCEMYCGNCYRKRAVALVDCLRAGFPHCCGAKMRFLAPPGDDAIQRAVAALPQADYRHLAELDALLRGAIKRRHA